MTGKYDLVVVGGGISGSIAAIAAARMGVDTLLIEQYGFLGGSLTANGVGPMMTFHAGDEQVVQGITGEMIDRLVKKGKSPGHIFDTTGYTYSVTPFDAEAMKHELEITLLEAGGKILYHTMLAAVTTQDDKIISITVCNKDGLSEINGELFIDATGDGDLASRAGVPYQKGRKKDGQNQPMTMNLKMGNVDIARVRAYIKEHPEEFPRLNNDTSIIDRANRLSIGGFVRTLEKAKKEGAITFEREDILFFETNNPGEVIINVTRILNHDATDAGSLSEAEIEGRRQVRELEAFMKERIPGFENAHVLFSGPNIGIRSSRQIEGVYTLTAEDILECRQFEDTIAHGGYPIDIHSPDGEGTFSQHLEWGDIYSIPYRTLINDHIKNIITVGRCISVTFEAQAAIRVSPIAGAIGHAGGAAAALVIKDKKLPAEIDIKKLQNAIREQGGYLLI